MMDDDLIDLISACRGGDLAPARCEQLLARLRSDGDFRATAAAELRMLGMLKAVQYTEPRWLMMHEELGCGTEEKTAEDLERDFLQRVREFQHDDAPVPRKPWAYAAVAAVLLTALTVRLWPTRPSVPPTKAAGALAKIPKANGFAVVIQLVQAEWEPLDGPAPAEGDVVAARRLRLRAGRATLAFLSGVTLTLEGPADIDVVSLERVFCRRGRLRARVPEGAEGFVVASPNSAVVDLGTEFGLNVDGDGKSQVMVFEGKAEAAVLNEVGSPLRSRQVVERHAFEIDPKSGLIEEATARSENFVRPPALAIPPLAVDPSYRQAVLDDRPWGYWRFESIDQGAVANEVAGRPPLRATGPVRAVVAGDDNRCAEFSDDPAEQSFEMDGLWETPTALEYAVELWALPEKISHAALAGLIESDPTADDYKHLCLLELTASVRLSSPLLPPASARFLHRWPPAAAAGDNVFGARYYIPYRWHHLVAQSQGGRMELYMDGVLTRSTWPLAEHATKSCRLLLGRLKPLPRLEGRGQSRPFVGRMDELALYNHILTPEEVRHHYELGVRGGRSRVP